MDSQSEIKTIYKTERLSIDEARDVDIYRIMQLEEDPDNSDFIWVGTYDEHLAEIHDPNHRLYVFRILGEDEVMGYALIRLDFKSNIFELRRFVIDKKGMGYGKEALKGLLDHGFLDLNTNRFWLDVYPHNEIGIKLYEGIGFHCDGVLRENYKAKDGYRDQIIYSMLRCEYEKLFS